MYCFAFPFPAATQQLFRSQNPGNAGVPPPNGPASLQQSVPPPPPTQAQFLSQQNAAYAAAAAAQQAASAAAGQYVINAGQEPYMGLIPTPVPQYYNLPWGCYPAGLIQQQPGTQPPPRRPLTPSQQPGADAQSYQVSDGGIYGKQKTNKVWRRQRLT